GVELAGTLAEMKRYILPKDYPELNFEQMKIILVEGGTRVLGAMAEKSSEKAHHYLRNLGIEIRLATFVNDYDGTTISLRAGDTIATKTLIWAAGVKGNFLDGLPEVSKGPGNRVIVNAVNQVEGTENVFAIGDVAL